LLARIALFALGVIAAVLVLGILGFEEKSVLLFSALAAVAAAEWLKVGKRLHASGIEEGLCVAGYLMLAAWIATTLRAQFTGESVLILAAAAGVAGMRLLNPFVTTCAVVAFVEWAGSTVLARGIDQYAGTGSAAFLLEFAIAMAALMLGARGFRRPSHDRMLDWLVACLPIAAYARWAPWSYLEFTSTGPDVGAHRIVTVAVLLVSGAALLTTGLRRRRHAPLIGFLGCLVGLAVELRFATGISNEAWLLACGFSALVAGALLDRWLRVPRHGLTSVPADRGEAALDLLQTAGAAIVSQRSAPEPVPEASVMSGEGGRFGGGGASGGY
jgi:hypothetical protein